MTADTPRIAAAREGFAEIGGERIKRHIFLCAESEKAKCCPR